MAVEQPADRGSPDAHDAGVASALDEVYKTPQALRAALTDRIKRRAEQSDLSFGELWAQFAYGRLLARIFTADPDNWVLKGATSLLAQVGEVRHTKDVDLWRKDNALELTTVTLQNIGRLEYGDYFRFVVSDKGRVVGKGGVKGRRLHVEARLGGTTFCAFNVDVVVGVSPTAPLEQARSLCPIELAGLAHPLYWCYPLVDHTSDKVAGVMLGPISGRPSTRYRDLADLTVLARTQRFQAQELERAVRAGFIREGRPLPETVAVPDTRAWTLGYAAVAEHAPGVVDKNLDAALETVRALLDPVLCGKNDGRWDPKAQRWE